MNPANFPNYHPLSIELDLVSEKTPSKNLIQRGRTFLLELFEARFPLRKPIDHAKVEFSNFDILRECSKSVGSAWVIPKKEQGFLLKYRYLNEEYELTTNLKGTWFQANILGRIYQDSSNFTIGDKMLNALIKQAELDAKVQKIADIEIKASQICRFDKKELSQLKPVDEWYLLKQDQDIAYGIEVCFNLLGKDYTAYLLRKDNDMLVRIAEKEKRRIVIIKKSLKKSVEQKT